MGVRSVECASETDGAKELSRLADERKRRKEKNVCVLFSISESLRFVLGCSNRRKRRGVGGPERRPLLSPRHGEARSARTDTLESIFPWWFYRRPCGLTARLTFPREGFLWFFLSTICCSVISRNRDDARSRVSRRYDGRTSFVPWPSSESPRSWPKVVLRFRPKTREARSSLLTIITLDDIATRFIYEKRSVFCVSNEDASQATRTHPKDETSERRSASLRCNFGPSCCLVMLAH